MDHGDGGAAGGLRDPPRRGGREHHLGRASGDRGTSSPEDRGGGGAGAGRQGEAGGWMVSRGCGRRMRAILRELKKSPENKLSRPQLEDALVEVEHDRSNTLRAIRALVRAGSVVFTDARRKEDSYVRLSPPTEPLPESEVWKILRAVDKDRVDTQKGGDR